MSDVVQLHPKTKEPAPRFIWVCNCGCSTFRHLDTGDIECANCSVVQAGVDGDWRTPLPPATNVQPSDENEITTIDGVLEDFGRRHIEAKVSDDTISGIFLVHRTGAVQTWTQFIETTEQRDWLRGRLQDAIPLIEVNKKP